MEISGFVKSSLIDYPQKIAAVIFTQGCNFSCGFCHNPDLIEISNGTENETEVIAFLRNRINRLDGVVITGGEPTIQKDLVDFIATIKNLGFLVKLDTNGSNPKVISDLLNKNLLDYIAMDIKGTIGKYQNISGYVNNNIIQESINMLKKAKIMTEFRTTVVPYYHQISDFEEIGEMIEGSLMFTVQGFRPGITLDKKLVKERSFERKELNEIAGIMKKYVKVVQIHDNL